MIRLALLLLALIGPVMAKPLEQQPQAFDPLKQRPTPEGFRQQGTGPSDAETALDMWRMFMGEEPMPDNLRQQYGIPPEKKKR